MHYKFLIYISYSYALPIGIPLEKEILKRGYTVYWFSDLKEGRIALGDRENVLESISTVCDYKPDIILSATDNVPDFINCLKVQIFHGFNAEKRTFKKDHFRIRGLFDLYCTQGPSTTSVFKDIAKKRKHFEVIETGWSKVDPLFPVKKRINPSLSTIFIASTFTERLSLAHNHDVFETVKTLSQNGKYRFIMVLHPKIPNDIKAKWADLSNAYFSYFDTTDLIPLFRQADIMFSDTTSAIQEFGLQNKPIVTFNHYNPKPYLLNITSARDIEPAIEKALSQPEDLLKQLAAFNEELHPYTDGKSSARVVDATIEFLHRDKSYMKTKPLNLVRKYKIRKRLNHFTLKSYNKPFTLPVEAS